VATLLLIACPLAMPSMRNCVDLLGIQDYSSCRLGIGDYCRTKYLQTGNWNEALQYMRRTCIAIQENDCSLAHPLKYTVAPPNSSNAAAGASKQGTDYCIPSDVSRLLLSPHRQLPYPHCSVSSRLILLLSPVSLRPGFTYIFSTVSPRLSTLLCR